MFVILSVRLRPRVVTRRPTNPRAACACHVPRTSLKLSEEALWFAHDAK